MKATFLLPTLALALGVVAKDTLLRDAPQRAVLADPQVRDSLIQPIQIQARDDTDTEANPVLVNDIRKIQHLNRRDRQRHHHHHHHHHQEKRADDAVEAGQAVYTVPKGDLSHASGESNILLQEKVGHAETTKDPIGHAPDEAQRVLVQGGSVTDPSAAISFEKSKSDQAETEAKEDSNEGGGPKKGTVLMAAVPILLVMGAIAGFTVYRKYYENSFNQGGRNDTDDDLPGDGYHRRDLPLRKGSPIHFDRTFLNTIHSPPPTATYLHDPDSPRNTSPSSINSANAMKRPPPSAGSHGKTRFQELSRSYDFGAGFRSIRNALSRSNNASRDAALDQATSASGSNASLQNKAPTAFGAGGHSLAKIGSHPGLNALERQQLQQKTGGSSSSRFPDVNNMALSQEHSIIWGQYSANDDDVYHSNLARKSASSNSLSGGKYSHHHQQSSGHQPDTPTDSIGDCLSPESPSLTREEMMRRRALYSEGYTFGSEGSGTDAHSGTDLLFDAREHFFDLGAEKAHDAALRDEEMDMYLDMEKEESPYLVDDYNTMNPSPYEPKVVYRHHAETEAIQKTAAFSPVQDEEKAAMAEADAMEETHVLGCDSPEWHAPPPKSRDQVEAAEADLERVSAQSTAHVAFASEGQGSQLSLANSSDLNLAEWEEDTRASTQSLNTSGAQQGHSNNKKKGSKSKGKKGRKH